MGFGALTAQQSAAPAAAPAPQPFTVQPGTPQDEEPVAVIRSFTRRVVVDVVVTDAEGKPVEGLSQQDFTVFEDRKPQSVRAFEVHTPEQDRSLLPPAPSQLPGNTFINLEQTPASGPPVVILIDYLNTPLEDQAYAHEQIVQFLKNRPDSTEAAIFTLTDNLSLLQGFTTDTERLLAAMRSKAAGLRMAAQSDELQRAQTTLAAFEEMGKFLAALKGRKNLLWFSGSFDMLVLPNAHDAESGNLIAGYEQVSTLHTPGAAMPNDNKNSSFSLSGASGTSDSGFRSGTGDQIVLREEMRKVAMALAVSQTAVYPIDVRGLTVDPAFTAGAGSPSLPTNPRGQAGTPGMPTQPGGPPASVKSHNDWMQSLDAAHATMQEIAEATGGHAFMNSNGLAAAAGRAVRDGSSYYTLVYAPSNLNFDGGLRSIHVTVNKPGCKLAYRSAYYAVDAAAVTPDAIQNDSLAAAMVHGAPDAQGLVFKAEINPDGEPAMAAPDSPLALKAALTAGKNAKKPRHLSGMVQTYRIHLAILAKQLQLTESPDGRHHAALRIGVCAYAADGQMLGGMKQNLVASMPPAVYAQTIEEGMFHNLRVELPVEAATLRLAILDPGSRHSGSLEVALPLPPAQQAGAAQPAPRSSPAPR
jgi:VWFA-related protein